MRRLLALPERLFSSSHAECAVQEEGTFAAAALPNVAKMKKTDTTARAILASP